MIELINEDRAAVGLSSVTLDRAAASAAQKHADEMARYGYMSHWDLDGHGPHYRYTQEGGLDASSENVYRYWHRYEDGSPVPIEDWQTVVLEAQRGEESSEGEERKKGLMDSEGHRANILAPEHTGVGIGIAYNGNTGDVCIDQLFIDHYVTLWPLPLQAGIGEQITLKGRLEPAATNPLLNVAYEEFPEPMTIDQLNQTGFYEEPSHIYDAIQLEPKEDGLFEQDFVLDYEGRPGLYHVMLWVDTEHGETLVSRMVIEVQ